MAAWITLVYGTNLTLA